MEEKRDFLETESFPHSAETYRLGNLEIEVVNCELVKESSLGKISEYDFDSNESYRL